MVLVFFMSILVIIILMLIAFIFSTLRVRVEELNISNYNNQNKFVYDFEIYFELYLFDKLKILNIKIDEKKLKKLNIEQKIKKLNLSKIKKELPDKQKVKEIIKKLNINISKFNLKIDVGIEDVIITSAIVAVLSTVLGIGLSKIIKKYNEEKYKYIITPLYINKFVIKIYLNCIIKVKVVHIIYIIYFLLKRRRVYKHERTSNRRSYDYSYE